MENKTERTTQFKQWCAEHGHTARSISEKLGISIQTVYSYMEGRRTPSRATMKLLEDHYGFNSRDIFPL